MLSSDIGIAKSAKWQVQCCNQSTTPFLYACGNTHQICHPIAYLNKCSATLHLSWRAGFYWVSVMFVCFQPLALQEKRAAQHWNLLLPIAITNWTKDYSSLLTEDRINNSSVRKKNRTICPEGALWAAISFPINPFRIMLALRTCLPFLSISFYLTSFLILNPRAWGLLVFLLHKPSSEPFKHKYKMQMLLGKVILFQPNVPGVKQNVKKKEIV